MTAHTLRPYSRVAWILLALLSLAVSTPVLAGEPDYAVPGRLALPWPCGEAYEVTWGPEGHWAHGKATGIAFDLSLPSGTPLFAPANGTACSLLDERFLETNLGHHVEIVVSDDWLVRLAHLRDPQSGEREVSAGELIGYSGDSGVASSHLHLEVLVREGAEWVRPELARMERFFGLPMADFVEGALIANDGCRAHLELVGAVRAARSDARLGKPVDLVVPLRNDGLEPLDLRTVQVSLHAAGGSSLVGESQGEWRMGGKSAQEVVVRVWPNLAGTWLVENLTCRAGDQSLRLSAEGLVEVEPCALRLVGITPPRTLEVGGRIILEAWVENLGDEEFVLEDLVATGVQPDGAPWAAAAGQGMALPPGGVRRVVLQSPTMPYVVGGWEVARLGWRSGDRVFFLGGPNRSFTVVGPELVLDDAAIHASEGRLSISLTITNVGTREASPDGVEVWGWKPGGEEHFAASDDQMQTLAPGESAELRLETALDDAEGLWRVVEAGYWVSGEYIPIKLTEELSVLVGGSSPVANPRGSASS